ncbi:MAG: hypothetical protein K9M54_00850 [Kiritimatiellales bacterium]|nr:hypothetical protein [Kiritimatiellales bacterium]MCF7863240.1 hypothetical protein [Kiritimatiellales bacterium]
MNKIYLTSALLSAAMTVCGSTTVQSGNWNNSAAWDDGVPYWNDSGSAVNGGYAITIPSGTEASTREITIGAGSDGTLVVEGVLHAKWGNATLGAWNSGNANGTMKVLGGTVGAATNRFLVNIGMADADGINNRHQGTLQIGDGTTGGYLYARDIRLFNATNMLGTCRIDVQGGTLDAAGYNVAVGYMSGSAATALMEVGRNASVKAGTLVLGNDTYGSSASLTVSGSEAAVDIAADFSLLQSSELNVVFGTNGISTITANKFWFSNTAVMTVIGTSGIATGRYDLVTGLTGGSGTNLNFNVNGFGAGYTVDICTDTSGGALTYYADVATAWHFEMGACEHQLMWLEGGDLNKQMEHLDAMFSAGARWIRLTLLKPFGPNLISHIKHCNELGIQVLIQLASRPEIFPPGTERRPGNRGAGGVAWPSYRLSDLDLTLSEQYLREFCTLLQTSNAVVSAIELFNEINWNGFNGDLPLVDGGLWIDESTPWDDPVFVKYREGILRVAQLSRIVRDLDDEFFNGAVKIITAGQVGYTINSNWVASVQGVLASPALTLKLIEGSLPQQSNATNYLQYVDGIGMHLYPAVDIGAQTAAVTAYTQIATNLDPLLSISGVGTTKPYWITETGYARSSFGYNETNRLAQLLYFHDALAHYDRPKSAVAATFLYCFSAELDPAQAVWENRTFLKSADIFKIPATENKVWESYLFEAWQVQHFGGQANNDLLAGDTADFDGDGVLNLYEYATGGDPADPGNTGYVLRLEPGATGSVFRVFYAARTNDPQVACELQWSDHLMPSPVWKPVSGTASSTTGTQLESGIGKFAYDETSPASNGFLRLHISRTETMP